MNACYQLARARQGCNYDSPPSQQLAEYEHAISNENWQRGVTETFTSPTSPICTYTNAYANHYCSGSVNGPSLQQLQEEYWEEEYESVLEELLAEEGKPDLFSDPYVPAETVATFQAEVDMRFCERIGGDNCADGLLHIMSAGAVVGVSAAGTYALRSETRNIVADSVQRQIARGWPAVLNSLPSDYRATLKAEMKAGHYWRFRMAAGFALQRAVIADLVKHYGPERFVSRGSYGPDIEDTKNKINVEITTRFSFKRHYYRPDPRYRSAVYVLYRSPNLPPERR